MPPHITILYPFVGARRVDEELARRMRELLDGFGAFGFSLTAVNRFPGVVYLEPEPAETFVQMTTACAARWPEHPPFEGRFERIVPHLTIPERLVAEIEPRLPIPARADRVWLMARRPRRGWSRRAEFALGPAT